jgi:hypothetical protein
LEACFADQVNFTAFWHEHTPDASPACSEEPGTESLCGLVLVQHFYNFNLWHTEDEARRMDVDSAVIAGCKRRIDGLNQKRNDAIEAVDRCLVSILEPLLPKSAPLRQNTETVGMAIDRLSILALKIYHMEEQAKRRNVSIDHIRACSGKLDILNRQRRDLAKAILELIADYAEGVRVPALYSQFKMYNDPALNPAIYGKMQSGKE